MRKLIILFVLLLFAMNFLSCGGGSSSFNTSGRTTVTINLGQTRSSADLSSNLLSSSSIPAEVTSIKFTILAPDMATIIKTISVSGSASISESFVVPNGPNRLFLVEAIDAGGNVLYRGQTYADLKGGLLILSIVMVSTDTIPPYFSGMYLIDSITTTSMRLNWTQAIDNITPQANIQYLIYMATGSGEEDLGTPSFTTKDLGSFNVTFNVTGLSPDTTYYFIVRAMDEAGNIDSNVIEHFAKTLALPDTTQPSVPTGLTATAVSSSQINLSWNASADNVGVTGYRLYRYNSYLKSVSTNSTSDEGLNPSTQYCYTVSSYDAANNESGQSAQVCATTLVLPPPPPSP